MLLENKGNRAPDEEARMTFIEHLAELRTRIIRAAISVFVAFVVSYIFADQIFEVIKRPLTPLNKAGIIKESSNEPAAQQPGTVPREGAAPEVASPQANPPASGPKWTVLNPLEPFLVKLKLAGYAAFLLASPFVIYQLCAFIFPGLKPSERKLVRILLFGCAGFALFGVLVAYFAVFPFVLNYLMTYVPPGVEFQFRMNETIGQIILGLMGFAVAFQFPMVALSLVYMGLLHPSTLKRYRRIAIVVMAIAAAVLTPPDPISMMMMLVPMVILYEASIWLSYVVLRRKKAQEAAS